MSTSDEKLLALMENPNIVKALQKLLKENNKIESTNVGRPRIAHERKPSYVNITQTTCSLCGAKELRTYVMGYDTAEKLYRILYTVRPGFAPPPELPLKTVGIIADNCSSCFDNLMRWDKEDLVSLLISKEQREQKHYNCLEQLAEATSEAR